MENKAEKGIEFSTAVYEHFLREIYDGFDTSNDIEPQAWKEALRLMNEATVEGISSAETTGSRLSLAHDKRFLNNLRHSNEVFTAFKVHSMGVKMAERLYDSKGNLRSFAEFQQAVAPIASHQVGSWLRTEYNTAVRRAHLAADWQEFEANKDIFPNLRWMPTTSPNAEGSHRIYWERKLTLPINDPFWAKHHPGDRWNCKCSLEATDAPPTAPPSEREAPKPQRGLDRNPKDGQLFSDKHPYFPDNCASCPFNKDVKNKLAYWFSNRKKDCYNCAYVDGCIEKAKVIEERLREYERLKNDPNYKEVEFNPETGGLKAVEKGHNRRNSHKNERYYGLTSSELEEHCQNELFKQGRKVVMLKENKVGHDGNLLSALDLEVDGRLMDIRSITKDTDNYVNALTAKLKQLYKFNKISEQEQGDTVCLYFHDPATFSEERMSATITSYKKILSSRNQLNDNPLKNVLVVVRGEKTAREYTI